MTQQHKILLNKYLGGTLYLQDAIEQVQNYIDRAIYYKNICNNEISNEYMQNAKNVLEKYLGGTK